MNTFCVGLCLAVLAALGSAAIDDSCISCIGQVERGGPNCNMDVGSLSCGKYQIKEPYWIDCGKPGNDWPSCAIDESCAKRCIKAYMKRYGFICQRQLNKSSLSCYDYGRLHNGGPSGCSYSSTLKYERKMKLYC